LPDSFCHLAAAPAVACSPIAGLPGTIGGGVTRRAAAIIARMALLGVTRWREQ
jgi:hypothetical protein